MVSYFFPIAIFSEHSHNKMKHLNYTKLAKLDFVQQLSSINSIIIHQPWINLNYIYIFKGTNGDFESPVRFIIFRSFLVGSRRFWDSRPDSSRCNPTFFHHQKCGTNIVNYNKIKDIKIMHSNRILLFPFWVHFSFIFSFCVHVEPPQLQVGALMLFESRSRAPHVRQQSAALHPTLWQRAAQERRKIVHSRDARPHNGKILAARHDILVIPSDIRCRWHGKWLLQPKQLEI